MKFKHKKIPLETSSSVKKPAFNKKLHEDKSVKVADEIVESIEKISAKHGFEVPVMSLVAVLSNDEVNANEKSVGIGYIKTDEKSKLANSANVLHAVKRVEMAKSALLKFGLDIVKKDPKAKEQVADLLKELL